MTDLNIASSIEPKSDQQNYDDYIAGPKIVTISEVRKGTREQPYELHLVEYPGRPYKPSKSMRRVLVAAWGGGAAVYAGRSLELYGDPTVRFGGQEVGGIKIRRMSALDGPVTIQLTVSRGKREPYTVEPLYTRADAAAWIESAESLPKLQQAWGLVQQVGLSADPELVALKDARKEALSGA